MTGAEKLRDHVPVIARLFLFLLASASAAKSDTYVELLVAEEYFAKDPDRLKVIDLDGDGDLDLVQLPQITITSQSNRHAYWIDNLGAGGFAELKLCHFAPTAADEYIVHSAAANLTGRGLPDIFASRERQMMPLDSLHEPLALVPRLDGLSPVEGRVLAPASPFPWQALDLDGDGSAELLQITRAEESPWMLRVHDRQADGSYAESTVIELGAAPGIDSTSKITVLDLEGDGDLDISIDGRPMLILERIGNRSFSEERVSIAVQEYASPESWTDLNGNGLPDLLLTDGSWKENLGSLQFSARPALPARAWTDFSGFHKITPRPGMSARVDALLGLEGGGHEFVTGSIDAPVPEITQPLEGFFPTEIECIALEDFDGDGNRDLMFTQWGGPNPKFGWIDRTIGIFWGTAAGLGEKQRIYSAWPLFNAIFTEDFDGDGRTDLLLGPDSEGRYYLRRNQGIDGLGGSEHIPTLDLNGFTVYLTQSGDVNQDSHVDLIAQCFAVGERENRSVAAVAYGNGDGSFQPLNLSTTPAPVAVWGGEWVDWDLDGDPDLVGGGHILENIGGAFPLPPRHLIDMASSTDQDGYPVTTGFTLTGDLDSDGIPDILSAVYGEPEKAADSEGWYPPAIIGIGYGGGDGNVSEIVEMPARIMITGFGVLIQVGNVAIADLDLDGHDDIIMAKMMGVDLFGKLIISIYWLRNPGDGSRDPASWASAPLSGDGWPGGPLADFDGDGSLEWMIFDGALKPSSGGPVETSGFKSWLPPNFGRLYSRGALDFDGDQDADIVINKGFGSAVLLLHNPQIDGRSRITHAMVASGIPGNLAGPDLDADGDGRTNVEELLTGTDPTKADAAHVNPFETSLHLHTEGGAFLFRLPTSLAGLAPGPDGQPLSPATLGLHYHVENSLDLKHWTPLEMESVEVFLFGGGWVYLSLPIPREGPQGYFRLRGEHRRE